MRLHGARPGPVAAAHPLLLIVVHLVGVGRVHHGLVPLGDEVGRLHPLHLACRHCRLQGGVGEVVGHDAQPAEGAVKLVGGHAVGQEPPARGGGGAAATL